MTKYLTRAEAAEYLAGRGVPYTKLTLQKFVTTGGGPLYRRLGNRALYTTEDLDAWIEARMSPARRSSSDVREVA